MLLRIALILFWSVGTCMESSVVTQVLFEKPKSEGEYRIPGMIALKDGTILAFCADRKGRGDFGHDTTTVIRRSTDGGKTWDAIREITAKSGADIHSGPVVQDRDTGRVFKFCRFWPATKEAKAFTNTKSYSEMVELGWIDHFQTSDDSGKTWSDPQPMRMDFPDHVVSAATGNGIHGIQLEDGRLLIQGGYSERRNEKLLRRCCVFASDDRGENWKRILDIDTAKIGTIREFTLAETEDGKFVCNIRSKQNWRAIFDGGRLRNDDELGDIECHAGLAVGPDGDWYFTQPNPVDENRKLPFNERRQRLTLRISPDQGQTWPREILIHDKAAAYSDVAVLPDRTVLVLFENGDRIGDCYQRISLARIAVK